MTARWLVRNVAHPAPYMTLCLSEEEYRKAMRHCKVKDPGDWVKSSATTHILRRDGKLTTIVCLNVADGVEPIQVASMLVHEAVHIWQAYAEGIGERAPGDEQEAYAVQAISQTLMYEYARRLAA